VRVLAAAAFRGESSCDAQHTKGVEEASVNLRGLQQRLELILGYLREAASPPHLFAGEADLLVELADGNGPTTLARSGFWRLIRWAEDAVLDCGARAPAELGCG